MTKSPCGNKKFYPLLMAPLAVYAATASIRKNEINLFPLYLDHLFCFLRPGDVMKTRSAAFLRGLAGRRNGNAHHLSEHLQTPQPLDYMPLQQDNAFNQAWFGKTNLLTRIGRSERILSQALSRQGISVIKQYQAKNTRYVLDFAYRDKAPRFTNLENELSNGTFSSSRRPQRGWLPLTADACIQRLVA